uniref:Uncharacterized protein n=1 Tax=Oryza glumipatula TaxID=40148 RepID=A0A0E0AJH1_9ORYZ
MASPGATRQWRDTWMFVSFSAQIRAMPNVELPIKPSCSSRWMASYGLDSLPDKVKFPNYDIYID